MMSMTRQFIAKTGITLAVAMGTSSCTLTQEGQQQARDPAAPQQLQIPANTDKPTKHTPTKEDEILKILRELRAKQNAIEAELKKNQESPARQTDPVQPQISENVDRAAKDEELLQALRDLQTGQNNLNTLLKDKIDGGRLKNEIDALEKSIKAELNAVEKKLKPEPTTAFGKFWEKWVDEYAELIVKYGTPIANGLAVLAFLAAWVQLRDANKQSREFKNFSDSANTNAHDALYFAQLETAITRANRTVRDIENGNMGDERIGDFPEMLSYLTERLQTVKRQVIITIPFTQFGVLGNPRVQYDFRQTLYDKFGEPEAASEETDSIPQADKIEEEIAQSEDTPQESTPQIVIITYDLDKRKALAADRYNSAPDALRLLHNRPLMEEFMTRAIDKDALGDFRTAVEKFIGLDNAQRRRLYELASEQPEGTERKTDDTHDGYLALGQRLLQRVWNIRKDWKDQTLQKQIRDIRVALSAVMERQEEANQFPKGAIILPILNESDNRMSLCIDGVEIITCESYMEKISDRRNRIHSILGDGHLSTYSRNLQEAFKDAGESEVYAIIINELDNLIKTAKDHPSVPNLSAKIDVLSERLGPNPRP